MHIEKRKFTPIERTTKKLFYGVQTLFFIASNLVILILFAAQISVEPKE